MAALRSLVFFCKILNVSSYMASVKGKKTKHTWMPARGTGGGCLWGSWKRLLYPQQRMYHLHCKATSEGLVKADWEAEFCPNPAEPADVGQAKGEEAIAAHQRSTVTFTGPWTHSYILTYMCSLLIDLCSTHFCFVFHLLLFLFNY